MDFNLTQEQTMLADSLRRYLARSYGMADRKQAMAEAGGYSGEHWRAYADMGVLALNVPEAHGGLAPDGAGNPLDTMVVMREFGRALVVEPYWMSAVVCANAIVLAGSEVQQAALLPALADGSEVFALAALEPGARYDLFDVATRAEPVTGGWRLDGRKAVVLHGAQADRLVVSARIGGGTGAGSGAGAGGSTVARDGIALFVVPRGTEGLRAFDTGTVDGLRAAEITLDGVHVEAAMKLDGDGDGGATLARVAELAGAALCAEAQGIVEALLEATTEYVKQRKQFGVPIGKFQSLQHRIADMVVCVEQVRGMAAYAALQAGSDDAAERTRAIAAARVAVAEASRFVARNAVQLHGGMGVTDELMVSHWVKRLTMLNRTLGDQEHHLAAYAAAMVA